MKFFNNIFLLFLCVGLFLTSCNPENIDNVVPEEPNYVAPTVEVNNLISALTSSTTTNEGLFLGCISVDYPFDLLLVSGETLTINEEADFEAAIILEGDEAVIDFVFPLNVTYEDETTGQINDNLELGASFASCIPTTGWGNPTVTDQSIPAFLFDGLCFDLVYPAMLEDLDGGTYTVNNEAELIDLCATVVPVFFTLPLTVVDSAGVEIEITNEEDFFNLTFTCQGVSPPVTGNGIVVSGFGCNEIQYPFEVMTPSGPVTVNNEDEYANLILSGTGIELIYPFSLMNEAGDILVINSIEELIPALEACGIQIIIDPSGSCGIPSHILLFFDQSAGQCGFELNFPVQLEAGGTVNDIGDMDAYFELLNTTSAEEIQVVYPVTISLPNGTIVTFENDEEICEFINEC